MTNGRRRTTRTKQPFGYGVYVGLQRFRFPSVRVHLSPRGYRKSPIHAFSIALGLKPQRLVRSIRSLRKAQHGAAGATLRRR